MTGQEKGYSLIVDVALFADGKTLLVKYTDPQAYDGEAGWFLPDASIRYLEHPDAAAQRVLRDQLRLSDQQPSISHIESFVGNDGSWHLSFHYLLTLEALPDLKPSEIVGSAEWFELSALPKASEIAHHGWALKTIKKIRPSLKRS